MPAIPTLIRSASLATFTLKADGTALPGTFGIVAIDISSELNRIPTAHLVLYDGNAAQQDFEISSGDLLLPGQMLEIEGGYNREERLLFKGIVTGQRIQVQRRGDSLLHVDARDAAFRMTLARRSRYFADVTDADVIDTIVSEYAGLTAEVEGTPVTYPEIVQYRVTDWDFAVSRAEKIGFVCRAEGGTLRVAKPSLTQPPALSVTYGVDVYECDLEMDARTQAGKVSAFAWDESTQELLSAEVDDVGAPPHGNLSGSDLAVAGGTNGVDLRHSGSLQQQEVDTWAEAGMLKSRLAKIVGVVRFQGTDVVGPGSLIELKGFGDRMNGIAFVSGIRHMFSRGEWETSVQIGLPRAWHHERFPMHEPPAAGFHPAIGGLHTGIVTKLADDPEGEHRIQLRLPLINPDDAGTWARVATLDAGSDRGTFFLPEIGDEVVVGFINDDPHEPVVLGMLHSSSKAAPLAAEDENHEKGLVTRSGMMMLFNDEAASLTIETPKGKKVVIDDQDGSIVLSDEHGNKISMDSAGIEMESPKDLTLKASADVTIEGLNVKVKAGIAATVEGSSSAALKGGATAEVKGGLVKIN